MATHTCASKRLLCLLIGIGVLLSGWTGCCGESSPPPPSIEPGQGPRFAVVAGSTRKICQLTGEFDDELGTPTQNRTQSRYKIWGLDLGGTLEHRGKLWILFGDTFASDAWPPTSHPRATSGKRNPLAGDSIAFSTDTNPTDCVALDFVSWPDGTFYAPDLENDGRFVQLDGISAGRSMYVWQTSDEAGSVLTKAEPDGRSPRIIYRFSKSKFRHLSAVVAKRAIPGLARASDDDWVLIFGNGAWHETDPYLAVAPLSQLEDRNALRFFAGIAEGTPRWTSSEDEATPIFDTMSNPERLLPTDGCVGSVDVHYSPLAEAWIALYDCGLLLLQVQTAAEPWGPWSGATKVFEPQDGGWCQFIHAPPGYPCQPSQPNPGRPDEPGGLYAPHVFERYTTGSRDELTLYFLVSTWNPYNTFVMSTQLRRSAD